MPTALCTHCSSASTQRARKSTNTTHPGGRSNPFRSVRRVETGNYEQVEGAELVLGASAGRGGGH